MPVTADSVIQENGGGNATAGSSVALTLPAGTTAGNTLLGVIHTNLPAGTITPPTGWVIDKSLAHNSTEGLLWVRKPNVAAGETSWTFTGSGSGAWAWHAAEVADLDPGDPVDASVTTDNTTALTVATDRSTGSTGANGGLSTVAVAVHAACGGLSGSPQVPGTFAGHTNGFVEATESASSLTATTANKGVSVSRLFSDGTTGPFECTATFTPGTGTPQHAYGGIVVYRAADSPVVSPLAWMLGFEHGSHNGLGSSLIGSSPLVGSIADTVGTDLIVQTGSARSPSVYGCRIVQVAAAKYVSIGTAQFGSGRGTIVLGWNQRTVSSTGVVVLAEAQPGAGTTLQLVYDSSATKIGLRWGSGGTVAYQPGTTAANTWAWITLRVTGMTGTTWHADWTLETSASTYTAQTSPADLTGQTASSLAAARWGANVAQTVTQDVDDLVCSTFGGSYPLAPHTLRGLTVDPAGTPTSSGTVGNFALVTSNATGAALTAGTLTSARDAVDELPPTISASSDGVVQTTTAASDYLQFPMNTYTAGPSEYIAAVRMLACLISTTGAGAGSLGIRGYDGTAETALMGTGFTSTPGSSTTPSSTVPPWVGYMWAPTNGWTQTKLDAAALRLGFSTDATPDMGVHAVYLEVAVGTARTQQLFGDLASLAVDPNRGGTVAVTVVAPAGYDTTLHYEESGTPTDVPVTGGASVTEQINAPFEADVNYIAAYPAAEPDPVD